LNELTTLFETKDREKDLIDRFLNLLERQTDHKLSPNMLLGYLGMFNVLSIMSVVHGSADSNIKEVSGQSESEENLSGQSVNDMLSNIMKPQSAGQPDLMGLLNSIAAKKKINPNLLLTLFNMLNSQVRPAAPPKNDQPSPEEVVNGNTAVSEEKSEKKTSDDKQEAELRYDRTRGAGQRS